MTHVAIAANTINANKIVYADGSVNRLLFSGSPPAATTPSLTLSLLALTTIGSTRPVPFLPPGGHVNCAIRARACCRARPLHPRLHLCGSDFRSHNALEPSDTGPFIGHEAIGILNGLGSDLSPLEPRATSLL